MEISLSNLNQIATVLSERRCACVFEITHAIVSVKQNFWTKFKSFVVFWVRQFATNWRLYAKKELGSAQTSEKAVERITAKYSHSILSTF